MSTHINPLSKRQRGIYSETIEKDNAKKITPTQNIEEQGASQLFKFIPKQKPQKALSLASLSQFQKAAQTNMNIEDRIQLNQRLKSRNELKRRQLQNSSKIITPVDPKVLEPFEPVPGQVPRNVAIDRRRKEFASYGLEELMEFVGVDFNKIEEQVEWLALEFFDDTTFDDNTPQNWLGRKTDENKVEHCLNALGLYMDREGNYRYRRCEIRNYNHETEKFEGVWKSTGRNMTLHRLYICFDSEDPRKYVLRLANAFQQRIYSDSIIRYNYYIDNMPIADLSCLDQEQKKRIENLAKSSSKLEDMTTDIGNLITEIDQDYNRTMNKIIFDEYLENMKEVDEMYPHHLRLPPKPKEKETPYLGAMELERNKGVKELILSGPQKKDIEEREARDFTETFKDFCFASLYIKEEVIRALQEIRVECNKVRDMKVFDTNLTEAMHLDQFKSMQENATSVLTYQLKSSWVDGMVKIIKTQFQEVGKGWFNMKETSKITYDFGKLKKFLTLVRLMMQDTLTYIVDANYHEFERYMLSFVPDEVEVISSNEVKNIFHDKPGQENLTKTGKKKEQKPLFRLDLLKTNDDQIVYSMKQPQIFVSVILQAFDKALEQMAKVPDLEPKILSDLYKSKSQDTPIKCPMKPREKPIEPDPNELPRKYPDENKWLWDMYENLKEQFTRAIKPLDDYMKSYDKYIDILKTQPDEYCRNLELREEPIEIEDISNMIRSVYTQKESLKENIPETIIVSCFEIHPRQLLQDLEEKQDELANKLKMLIAKRCRESTSQIFNSFSQIKTKIEEEPQNIEQLTDIVDYMNNMPIEIEKLKVDMDKCFDIYTILEKFNHKFSNEEMNKRWQVFGSPKEIYELIDERTKQLDKLKKAQLQKMLDDQEQFKEEYTNLEQTIKSFAENFCDPEDHANIAKTVDDVNISLKNYQESAKVFNSREALFESEEQSDYGMINAMVKEFQPYSILWKAVHGWKEGREIWINDEWNTIDAISCQDFIEENSKSLVGVIKFMKERGKTQIAEIAMQTKKEIDEFKQKVPLLVALRNRGMTDRHWNAIGKQVGKTIKYTDPEFNFKKVLDLGLMEHKEFCIDIGEKAGNEIMIENRLDAMEAKWDDMLFDFKRLEKQDINIIRGYDDITQILDEDIVQTQGMLFSPFRKPFEERIKKWDETLKNISDVLEEWAKLQGNWLYLQPIFDSKDIAKQLPQESKKFQTINSMWSSTMQQAFTIKKIISVCSDDGLCERLKDANQTLDNIQKELNKYLESKKEKFARFYFLSNDELLEILSQTKEPTAVQPHLKKVFENIHRISFDQNKRIHSMFSGENEEVPFVRFVDPVKKNVEDWMGELEIMMKKSVREALMKSIEDYITRPRKEWVVYGHPGQCVLNGSQVHWTSEVEEALNGTKEGWGITQYFQKLQEQLNDLVDLVVQPLTKMQQVTINALIVIDVHAKDVVDKLVQEKVQDTSAFEWISQLRYDVIQGPKQKDLFCKMVTTNFPYGYEYLGNTLRLVITPLTDKCYMTLMSALKLNYGGAPAGPAGTGKTESTKDLAKALAKQCVVFNCSDQMDYVMVGQFFKGLASAGAWCCFDEFNRINIEVLSVIAQMLRELYDEKAKQEKSGEGTVVNPINFQGSVIKVNGTFSVFITMNPGYAGRTELPDNLKALFRGVAMMVPDYAMIGEILLYSFGFKTGRELAKKMVVTFKLSSEQLSSQDHYDYGMRAVRSVINAAGLLKQDPKNSEMQEDQLLLRALRDVNVPKFLRDDIPLFENIIDDLFPTTERPRYEYGNLETELDVTCKELGLQSIKVFKDKVKQLYDTIQVRHGLMLVGPTGGGKTSNYKVLQKSMTALYHRSKEFFEVQTHILNPKSITMGQLYGEFTTTSHEWIDGIVAFIIRETVKDTSDRKHWVLFDGPVDAIWIESMNTVLDDNKKLCLNSGQILTLTPHMTMMFEVEDLEVASPATVSRCGMVYMEPISLGLQPLIDSWIDGIPENIREVQEIVDKLRSYFDQLVEKTLDYLYKNCKEIIPSMSHNLLQSCMRIIDCYLEPYTQTMYKKVSKEELQQLNDIIQSLFVFAFTWSFLCTTDNAGREKLNQAMKSLTNDWDGKMPDDEEGSTVYDYYFDTKELGWKPWSEQYKSFELKGKIKYHEMVIPTNDSARNIYMKKLLLQKQYNVLCPGTTGTGKSQNCYELLISRMGDDYQYIALTFSAQTSANQTQDTIDSKLDKRRKGIFGPPIGKRFIIFIDDLNMPKKEQYGAQPPIELLRQYLDHQGWYNRRELSFMKIEDVTLLSAMGPPGGGRTAITKRIQRHFNVIAYPELDQNIITQIFQTMVQFFYKRGNDNVQELVPQLIKSCLEVYYQVKEELLPTPSKSHYTFNMRDIYRVCQGLCSPEIKLVNNIKNLVKLWFHENMRVYHDRLTTDEDRQKFQEMLIPHFQKFEGQTKEDVLNVERIIFCDFNSGYSGGTRHYMPVDDLSSFINLLDAYQEEYNNDPSFSGGQKKQMKLVMFLDACEHIARIARILRQPQGNALLFGVGGSGRQSLSKMATFLNNYKLFMIEVVKNYKIGIQWKEDCKKVLMMAGVDSKPVTFLFVDTQIIDEQMLEDLNSILNSGDVTGIYAEKDFDEIFASCKTECLQSGLQPTKMNIFTIYLKRIKKNIHIILAMSPIGSAFQTRLRMFPSLVNCCTIDWFTEWPEEALYGVGKGQLIDYEEELKIQGQLESLVNMFKFSHKLVEKLSARFLVEMRRHNYVTPTSYLELLNLFRTILGDKNVENEKKIDRLSNGLQKLHEANIAVADMEVVLTKKQPELKKAQEETEVMVQNLKVEQAEAAETQKVVNAEEKIAQEQTEAAQKLAEECRNAVEDANRNLEATLKEIQNIKRQHLDEIKTLTTPPKAVVVVLASVVILMGDFVKQKGGIKMKKVEGSISGQKVEDYLATAKSYLLNDTSKLLHELFNYDRENINPDYIKKLEKVILNDPEMMKDFDQERAKKVNVAIGYLFGWSKAMYDFYNVYTNTQPLRDKLEIVEKEVEEKQKELKQKQDNLAAINARIQKLQENYQKQQDTMVRLNEDIQNCKTSLDRAKRLTSSLGDEKERWTEEVANLKSKGVLIAGNSALAACMLSYAGPFEAKFRAELEEVCVEKLKELGIKFSENITMREFLGNDVKIQAWTGVYGLPKDLTSIENGIIIDCSKRWPLMIDPQNQANKYIKSRGRDEDFICMKISEPRLMKIMEQAIQLGQWVLLESVGTELDPSLDPILLQQIVVQGNTKTIMLGDKQPQYNDNFKLYLTTTLPNPHYSPETSVKVTIINFAITPGGLEEQMLAKIVELEAQQLEDRKNAIVSNNAKDQKLLVEMENQILESLSSTKGGIEELLADESLIIKLDSSKKTSTEIKKRVLDQKITGEQIDKEREGFRPVAYRASILFFAILELALVDPMYQYSLQWYIRLFEQGQKNAPQVKEKELQEGDDKLAIRLGYLNDYFTESLYENVCRSLFEKDKLLFSFLLTQRILDGKGEMDRNEWKYLLSGANGEFKTPNNPTDWIDQTSWPEIHKQIAGASETLEAFKGFEEFFLQNTELFKDYYDGTDPQLMDLPGQWNEKLDQFEKLIILKAIRPDKVVNGVQDWIRDKQGQQFIESKPLDLAKCYEDSTIQTPLIFVLSTGSDPVADFDKFAEAQNMKMRNQKCSLGQGQGEKAANMIKSALQNGGWVLLQNCHLSTSWMPELEKLVEDIQDTSHKDFRLWLTSMPAKTFPVSVLQNGIKMTMEPPKGLKANLMRNYYGFTDDELNDCKKPDEFKKLLFGFCLFHAIIQERRKFGPIGWNIAYEFTTEDLIVCKRQLKMLLDDYEQIPYKVLQFLGSVINYGGRVTDDKDGRLIQQIIKVYVDSKALMDNYKFSESGIYKQPPAGTREEYMNYISELPHNPAPEAFGMHDNADITNAQNETRTLLETLQAIQPRVSSGEGKSREQLIGEIAVNIESQTPPVWDIVEIQKKFPTKKSESMNTVLIQELIRYNRLLEVMAVTLGQVQKALKGMIVMSEELESVANSLYDNNVPEIWSAKGHKSLKPLGSWIIDLKERVTFLNNWIDHGTPKVFWISGFFFPQAFITGTLQNHARKYQIAIDLLKFEYVIKDDMHHEQIKKKPQDGCYIYGIFLEGAKWDEGKHRISDPKPKELYSDLPLMHLLPIQEIKEEPIETEEEGQEGEEEDAEKIKQRQQALKEKEEREKEKEKEKQPVYNCPLYKTVDRRGTLSTTGHSTNFVMFFDLPTKQAEELWIRAGVAAFLSLRY